MPAASAAMAQEGTVSQGPPSLQDYSLPPGRNQQQDSRAQGPSDESTPPPRTIERTRPAPAPAPSASSPPTTATQGSSATQQPQTRPTQNQPPNTQPASQPSTRASQAQSEPSAARQDSTANEAPVSDPPASDTQPGFEFDPAQADAPPASSTDATAPVPQPATESEGLPGWAIPFGILALLLAAAAFWLMRRRRSEETHAWQGQLAAEGAESELPPALPEEALLPDEAPAPEAPARDEAPPKEAPEVEPGPVPPAKSDPSRDEPNRELPLFAQRAEGGNSTKPSPSPQFSTLDTADPEPETEAEQSDPEPAERELASAGGSESGLTALAEEWEDESGDYDPSVNNKSAVALAAEMLAAEEIVPTNRLGYVRHGPKPDGSNGRSKLPEIDNGKGKSQLPPDDWDPSKSKPGQRADFDTNAANHVTSGLASTSRMQAAAPVHIAIEFVAEKCGSTLVNTVLGYRLKVRNDGIAPVSGISVHGDMVDASSSRSARDLMPDNAAHLPAIGTIERLAPGEEAVLTGEIRTPFAAMQPLETQGRVMIVPVARFAAATDGASPRVHAFIVGQENVPPTPKLGPFRLDLGPRNFKSVGQRALVLS